MTNQTLTLTGISGIQYTLTPANMVIIHNEHKIPIAAEQLPVEDILMIADRLRHKEPGDFWGEEYMRHGY